MRLIVILFLLSFFKFSIPSQVDTCKSNSLDKLTNNCYNVINNYGTSTIYMGVVRDSLCIDDWVVVTKQDSIFYSFEEGLPKHIEKKSDNARQLIDFRNNYVYFVDKNSSGQILKERFLLLNQPAKSLVNRFDIYWSEEEWANEYLINYYERKYADNETDYLVFVKSVLFKDGSKLPYKKEICSSFIKGKAEIIYIRQNSSFIFKLSDLKINEALNLIGLDFLWLKGRW